MTDPIFDAMGRINLAPPSDDVLHEAATTVLGERSEVVIDGGGKVFRSAFGEGIFYSEPGTAVGDEITTIPNAVKTAILQAATKVRAEEAEKDRAKYIDPATNPMIKAGD